MTLATLGPEGTHSHDLASRLFGSDISLLPTIYRIFRWVEEGRGDGLVPIENSESGGVGATQTALMESTVAISGEAYMPIRHHLAACCSIDEVETLFVHLQTHEQCSRRIETLGVEVVHTSSNAASAQALLRTERAAAIIPEYASQLYKIPIVERNVQNNPNNTTRFVRISANPYAGSEATKCSILIDPQTNRAGLLHDLLSVFADRNINLSRIESRPAGRGLGWYVFFVDCECCDTTADAIRALGMIVPVRFFGCYPRLEVPE